MMIRAAAWIRPTQIRTVVNRLRLTGKARVKDDAPAAFSRNNPPIMRRVIATSHMMASC
jgi:hypothetical protein